MKFKFNTIISFLVIAIFVFQVLAKFIIVADYVVNKDFIAKTLCENKNKPKLKCNGKCHLAKQLDKQDKKEKPTTSSKDKFEIVYFQSINQDVNNEKVIISVEEKKSKFYYSENRKSTFLNSIFQPPRV